MWCAMQSARRTNETNECTVTIRNNIPWDDHDAIDWEWYAFCLMQVIHACEPPPTTRTNEWWWRPERVVKRWIPERRGYVPNNSYFSFDYFTLIGISCSLLQREPPPHENLLLKLTIRHWKDHESTGNRDRLQFNGLMIIPSPIQRSIDGLREQWVVLLDTLLKGGNCWEARSASESWQTR